MPENLEAGWGFPTAYARKEHWFAAGALRSGCGMYGRLLPVGTNPSKPSQRKFVCVRCERKADAAENTTEEN